MSYEMVVGLKVINDEEYVNYRAAMTPILESFGGGFRYDFKVDEVLKNEEGREINRVFTIHCKDKESMDAFFSHPDYQVAKSKFFENSVAATTIISEYSR
jgi:uncharacterized protein (DUF1330 family)